MMREIKFRAWHKFSEEIIPVVSIDFENQIINSKGPWRFFSEIDLMQYTGLKDKNGVEIFEGDFVWDGYENEWYTVVFDEGAFLVENDTLSNLLSEVHADCEIGGHIYEHPHLLEEK